MGTQETVLIGDKLTPFKNSCFILLSSPERSEYAFPESLRGLLRPVWMYQSDTT
jgi:hypothetical protein